MLILHLAAALLAGLVAAMAGLGAGFSVGTAFLLYVAGGQLGLLASVLGSLLVRRDRQPAMTASHGGEALQPALIRSDR